MTISKQTIKYLRSLQLKKFRRSYDNFVVEGGKIAIEVLNSQPEQVEGLYALPDWIAAHQDLLFRLPPDAVHPISAAHLAQVSSLKTPNQVLLVVQHEPRSLDAERLGREWSLVLDNIQDPGNLGTILRIADWFGIPFVFGHDCVDLHNPKVIQASMGAFLRVHYEELHLAQVLEHCPGLPVLGAYMDGDSIFETELPPAGLLVIGNEGQGISEDFAQHISRRVSIPSPHARGAESLNAAVATGILCAWLKGGRG